MKGKENRIYERTDEKSVSRRRKREEEKEPFLKRSSGQGGGQNTISAPPESPRGVAKPNEGEIKKRPQARTVFRETGLLSG